MLEHLDFYPLIIAGGSGTRLWPLSREKYPKQFHTFFGNESLLQATIQRLAKISCNNPPIVICNREHRFIAAEHLEKIQVKGTLILEPLSRNTAPAIALGAIHLAKRDPNAVMLILPADHWLSDKEEFAKAVHLAADYAHQKKIVTFGITPSSPETGYGYIHVGSIIESSIRGMAHPLLKFIEKPELQVAQSYVDSREYLWNSGMFCCTAEVFLSALEQFQPGILTAAEQAYEKSKQDKTFIFIDEESFASSPNLSIDHAIMEKIQGSSIEACVIPLHTQWSDVGSWSSIWQIADKDENNNATYGDVVVQDSHNCYIHTEDRLVATVGINDCIIIETHDAVLVANKNKHQEIRQVVNTLKTTTRREYQEHLLVHKPWGSYQQLVLAERHQVKHIIVKPYASLSLQMHYYRAEHWVVVKGTARVTRDKETFLLHENQSTYIPCGTFHRLENPGPLPLEIIEIQSGSYLGEDDIVRSQDQYGRASDERS